MRVRILLENFLSKEPRYMSAFTEKNIIQPDCSS